MKRKIVSVGFSLASDDVDYVQLEEKRSLLDWDIITFRPDFNDFIRWDIDRTEHQGKPRLGDDKSFSLREACAHWRNELKEAVESGKTVFVHLSKPKEVFIATGERQTSGTGRNQTVTHMVEKFDNYRSIPLKLDWKTRHGQEMTILPRYRELLSSYWEKFGALSHYEVVIAGMGKDACLGTRTGSKTVGIVFQKDESSGTMMLLPDMDFGPDDFFMEEDQDDENYEPFTDKARKFAASYIAEIVAIDRTLQQGAKRTPEPEWAAAADYSFSAEAKLQNELLRIEGEIEKLREKKDNLKSELAEVGHLRGLLYETGKPLEAAILKALRLLGFDAENYNDGKREFDAVFIAPEGRLLGEAEGKDSKAIAITKLRQLVTNILEDLERDEVDAPAKGVLFGNPYRLTPPQDRAQAFTEKCVKSADSQSVALVRTPDLFAACRYVSESGDMEFASQCRRALVDSVGPVAFPKAPTVPPAGASIDENFSDAELPAAPDA